MTDEVHRLYCLQRTLRSVVRVESLEGWRKGRERRDDLARDWGREGQNTKYSGKAIQSGQCIMKPKHCLCLICVMRVWSSLRCILPHATGPHSQLSEAPWRFCFFLEIPTGSCLTSLCTCVIKLPLNGASCDTDAAFGCSRLVLHSFKQGEHFPAQNHSKSEISLFFLSTSDCLCISVSLKL